MAAPGPEVAGGARLIFHFSLPLGVRLPGAPHYVYIQNEAEVVLSMREFLGIPLRF
jgi:hypothetical protein